jgi:hypothetical protein
MSAGLAFYRWVLIAVVAVACWATCASGGTIFALNPQVSLSFWLHGSGTLDVGAGTVQVNSSASQAALFQGSLTTFNARAVNIVGGYRVIGSPTLPPIHVGQPSVPDPLANVPAPTVPPQATYPNKTQITGVGDFYSGYYPNGIRLTSGTNAYLHPGVYVIDNGWDLMGGKLSGDGVMIYMHTGTIHDRGIDTGGGVQLSAPGAGEYYGGISIFQDRSNAEMPAVDDDRPAEPRRPALAIPRRPALGC